MRKGKLTEKVGRRKGGTRAACAAASTQRRTGSGTSAELTATDRTRPDDSNTNRVCTSPCQPLPQRSTAGVTAFIASTTSARLGVSRAFVPGSAAAVAAKRPQAAAIEIVRVMSTATYLTYPRRMAKDPLLKELRAIIEAWPETSEKLSHGAPTWWGGKKTFATFHSGNYDEGRPGVWIKAEDGAQEALVGGDPERFYRPKYLGPSGWVGVRLDDSVDWDMVRELLMDGYRLVAPKRALKKLDEG